MVCLLGNGVVIVMEESHVNPMILFHGHKPIHESYATNKTLHGMNGTLGTGRTENGETNGTHVRHIVFDRLAVT